MAVFRGRVRYGSSVYCGGVVSRFGSGRVGISAFGVFGREVAARSWEWLGNCLWERVVWSGVCGVFRN